MNEKCVNCGREFDSTHMFYCKKCKKHFCNDCKKSIFNLANNEEDLMKYLVNSQNIRVYCNDCEKTYFLNEIVPVHIDHDINFVTVDEHNNMKLLMIGHRGCGLGCLREDISLNDFINQYNINNDVKDIILNHEPVLLQQNKVLPFKETIYIHPTYKVYILNETRTIMLDLWNEGNNGNNIQLDILTSEVMDKKVKYTLSFNNFRKNELKNVYINYMICTSEKQLSDDERDFSDIEELYSDSLEFNIVEANSEKKLEIILPLSKKHLTKYHMNHYPNSENEISFNNTFIDFTVHFQNFIDEIYCVPLLTLPISLLDD